MCIRDRALEGRRILTAGMRRAAEEARLADEEDAEDFAANPEASDHHPDDDGSESSGSSEEPGGDEPERGGAGSEASPEVPTRRYPTPRRGERFANPWAD